MAAEASSASTSLARLISRRAKNDPQGFKDTVSKGNLNGYLLTETLRGKIATEAELDKFLQEHSKDLGLETPGPSSSASSSAPSSSSRGRDAEEAARKARAAADEMRRRIQSFDLEAVSLSIDTMVFDSMYDAETQGAIRKIMFDQKQKAMGLPTSEEIGQQELMDKVRYLPGSPFLSELPPDDPRRHAPVPGAAGSAGAEVGASSEGEAAASSSANWSDEMD